MSETATPERLLQGITLTDPNSAKGRLLQQARLLFRQKGFEKTTVRDIAAATGIQSGSIFHHFANKEEILRCVMEETICFSLAHLQEQLKQANTTEAELRTLIGCELDAIHSRHGHDFTILGYEWRSLNPGNQARVLEYRGVYEKLWSKSLHDAKAKGLCQQEGFLLRSFIRGALIDTINWYKAEGELNLEALADEVYRAFFR
ncbi:MAG: atu genes transcriptional repressor AtuR [Candidatus Pelagadaptatus aseana]|uniref:TetR/AcrR family transcriptional regulator n=1 Tax=Candidatus Pelagadaptatus aseana TaxID=3120508 RepID=UPI0039B2EF3E